MQGFKQGALLTILIALLFVKPVVGQSLVSGSLIGNGPGSLGSDRAQRIGGT